MGNPVVDLAPLAQPVTKLVEVVAQGLGTLYRPIGTIRQARADAEAKTIIAEAEIEVVQLQRRAAERLMHVEIQRQENLDAIVAKAQAALPDAVRDDPVAKDWTSHFFTAAQDVSDEHMQSIWGRILAGEVAEPGTISRRTLEFLKTMSKEEAELLLILMSVSFSGESGWHFIVEDRVTTNALVAAAGGTDIERHFVDIAILGVEPSLMGVSEVSNMRFSYGPEHYKFVGPAPPSPNPKTRLQPIEHVMGFRRFSSIGQQLSKVAQQKVLDNLISDLSKSLQQQTKVRIEKDFDESAIALNHPTN